MGRRFIVATNSAVATKEQRDTVTRYLEEQGWSVWHWFEDLWLVRTEGDVSLSAVRDTLRDALPYIQILVLSADGMVDHAGMVVPDGIPWIRENWNR